MTEIPAENASISRRAYQVATPAFSWEEIFEAGPYYDRISELLEDARHYAIFVGWQIDSRLPMPRPARAGPGPALESLREKILRLVESKPQFQFYFLMWDHAYFYVLEREAWQGRIWDNLHPRVHFLFDNRHPLGGSHHEKICIIDGRVAFCGGIDLCDERWDSPQHLYSDPRRSLHWGREHHGPYHDVAVQVTGPVVEEVHRHVQRRWRALSRTPFPLPVLHSHAFKEGEHLVYLSRTLARIDGGVGHAIIREIEFLFRDLIAAANRRIILEGQYYWSEEVNDMLIRKIHQMAGQDFEIVLILADLRRLRALSAEMSFYELCLIEKLQEAARSAEVKLTVGNPVVEPPPELAEQPPRPIYIHSKVIVIDDKFLSVGSANLSTRALRVDTELGLTLEARSEAERAHIDHFAQNLLTHWGLLNENANPSVHLRLIRAKEQIDERFSRLSWTRKFVKERFPWKAFFDPKVPWAYPLERRFRRLYRFHLSSLVAATGILWIISTAVAVALARMFMIGFPAEELIARAEWIHLYALALTSVWFVPIPFSWVAALATFQLGFRTAVIISVCSLWVASLQGYWLTRVFPTFLTRFYRTSGPSWLPKRLGLRQFPATVQVSLDPRVTLRSKIAYQGLYCVPIPWFAMNFLIVLPATLYGLLFAISRLEHAYPRFDHAIRGAAPKVLLAIVLYALLNLVSKLALVYFHKRRGTT